MKKSFTFLLLLFAFQQTQAQWREQGFELFQYVGSDWVEAMRAVDEQTVWAALDRSGLVFGDTNLYPLAVRTLDGGATWQRFQLPETQGHRTTCIAATDADHAWVAVRWQNGSGWSPGKILRTTDGGASWQTVLQDSTAGYMVHFFDNQHGLVFRGATKIQLTSDGGLTWRSPAYVPPAFNQNAFYLGGEFFDAVGDHVWFPLANGTVLKSTDRGEHWTLQTTPLAAADSVSINLLSFSDQHHGMAAALFYVAAPGNYPSLNISRLLRTSDGGATWEEIPTAQLPLQPDPGIFIRAIEAIPGTPGTYLLSIDNTPTAFETTHKIYITHDHGETWELYSDCPKSGFAIESFEFLSPTVGWGGTGGAFSQNDPFFYQFTDEVYQPTVTFRLDLGDLPPSPQGVHLTTSADGWNTTANPLTHSGGTLWETSLPFTPGETIQYKFLNGNAWGQNESVPIGCGAQNSAGSYDRELTAPDECHSTRLSPVRFGSCMNGDDLAPQTVTACDPNSNLLICETFETYDLGKLAPQSGQWSTYGCNYDGTEGDACDADVTSYWAGFTNYSGGRAAHFAQSGQTANLALGNQGSGRHELSMKMYVPGGASAFFYMEVDTSYWSGFAWISFTFNQDGSIFINRDWTNYVSETNAHFEHDQWFDLRLVFDADSQQREVWLDGQLVANVDDPYSIANLSFIEFSGYGGFFGFAPSDIFLDDVMLKALTPGSSARTQQSLAKGRQPAHFNHRQAAFKEKTASAACEGCDGKSLASRSKPASPFVPAERMEALQLFPNPASGLVQVRYQFENPSAATLQIFNPMGQMVQERRLGEQATGTAVFDLGSQPGGVYVVRLTDGKCNWNKVLLLNRS